MSKITLCIKRFFFYLPHLLVYLCTSQLSLSLSPLSLHHKRLVEITTKGEVGYRLGQNPLIVTIDQRLVKGSYPQRFVEITTEYESIIFFFVWYLRL